MSVARGVVYLVGAGPGDPGLLTRRGLELLRGADLVLYDALVHPELLELARGETIFVGKRAGQPSARQTRINEQLVEAARAGQSVVRLKGGDPYLFGRGSEEAEHLARSGVPFEVVPGVPSPLAATAYAGLSLTHRDLSSSVAYVTATESPGKDRSSHDWAKLATGTQTIVIFMGRRKLRALMELLIEHGRDPGTPAAVIARASLPSQRTLVATVATLADAAAAVEIEMPSLIVVGEVVRLREELRWFDTRPLFGRRVLVTRPRHQAGGLAQALRRAGAEPLVAPTIAIAPQPLTLEFEGVHWLALTSANTVDLCFAALAASERDARALGGVKIAVVGSKTQAALARHGLRADLVADKQRAEGLAAELLAVMAPQSTVLLPRSARARPVLADTLAAAGHTVRDPIAYDVAPADPEPIRAAFARCDTVTFTSGSTVDELVAAIGDAAPLRDKTLASIGPVTSDALRAHGLAPDHEAAEPSIEGLVDCLIRPA